MTVDGRRLASGRMVIMGIHESFGSGLGRLRRGTVGVDAWAASILESHVPADGECERCGSLCGSVVVWPCLPVRTVQARIGAPG